MHTSEELNSGKDRTGMGGMRHFPQKQSETAAYRPHMHITEKHEPWTNKSMKKIIENYLILKPKVERIGGPDDFNELVGGIQIMQKYNGVKQKMAKEQVAQKRVEERLKRTFGK